MEEDNLSISSHFKQRSFQVLHKRVQYKFNELQKKLEKSRSFDSLFVAMSEEEKANKLVNITELNKLQNVGASNVIEFNRSCESVAIQEEDVKDALFQEVDTFFALNDVTSVSYKDTVDANKEEDNNSISNDIFFSNNYLSTSNESLIDNGNESDQSLLSPPIQTPPPKVSFRQRISSRLNAVKERRIGKAKESELLKKKRESLKGISTEKVEKHIFSNSSKQDSKVKKNKIATITVALIEAKISDEALNDNRIRLLHCRFKLGTEKYKSKVIKSNAIIVKWLELININLYDDNLLEISLWDKDTQYGRSTIDLSTLKKETTHKMYVKLDEIPSIKILILLTITGTAQDISFEFDNFTNTQKAVETLTVKSPWYSFKDDYTDVGSLAVFVYGAMGLAGNDCYCVLELGNARLQTTTEFKTCDPNWMKMFTFVVTDVASILEITVYDEKKSEDVGKISINLLSIINGQKKWYALKDNTERERAKGNNPRILLESSLSWDLIKAARRVINTKEVKYLEPPEKLDRHIFARNLNRAKVVTNRVLTGLVIFKTCFEWDNTRLNVISLIIWFVVCWFFKIWMIPLLLLIPFITYRPEKYVLINWSRIFTKLKLLESTESKESDLDAKSEKDEKTSLLQRLNTLQEMLQSVQMFIGKVACFGESVKNLFNFTEPFLSFLAIILILLIALVMYLVPLQYILIVWGVHKFTRKILRPNRVPNNEIMDLLSRVPNDDVLLKYQNLPLEDSNEVII